MMSSLRSAFGPIAFSARQSSRCTDVSPVPIEHAASKAPSSAAAPPQSAFIPGIPSLGFSERPPVSYTMPLPTRQTDFLEPSGACERITSAGRSVAALPTPHSPP